MTTPQGWMARAGAVPTVMFLIVAGWSGPASADPRDFCWSHVQKVLQAGTKISQHNARSASVNRRSAAAVAVYNANAARLNAEKAKVAKAAQSCLDAIKELSISANTSKKSRSVGAMSGVDPVWQAEQIKLANEIRPKLAALIQKLLASQ